MKDFSDSKNKFNFALSEPENRWSRKRAKSIKRHNRRRADRRGKPLDMGEAAKALTVAALLAVFLYLIMS